ncbi:hypothetical protein ACHAXA_000373 [Cyclostephanos tholiformis]|uniref:Uncharacterized protein n=1 Tax=Cyclostephanos tholiformis TaxID=382380 RepID=A0ABD3R238_9STRA
MHHNKHIILQPTLRPPTPCYPRKRPHSDITSMDHHQEHGCSTKAKTPLHTASGKHGISIQLAVSSNHETASSSSESFIMTSATERIAFKNVILSPQEFFIAMLQSRGYPGTTYCSLKCAYHSSPTMHQMVSYGVSLTKAIRSSDETQARSLLSSGLHPNACNKFGESIVHAACRRGDSAMLRALLEARSSVQVTDDFGRTPLHDACWTSTPSFDTIRLLLDQDPWLPCIVDCRGSAPLGYVRKAHWAVWIGFLGAIADLYWPDLNELQNESKDNGELQIVPPLALLEPNSRPLPDPSLNGISLEIIEQLANGKITPRELSDKGISFEPKPYQEIKCTSIGRAPRSRITLDRMGSNAITFVRGSQNNAVTFTSGG